MYYNLYINFNKEGKNPMFKLYTTPNLDNQDWELVSESDNVMELIHLAKTYQEEHGDQFKLVDESNEFIKEVEL